MINGLHETGCEITVLTGQPNYPEGKIFKGYHSLSFKKEHYQGYSVIRVPLLPRGKSGAIRLTINYFSFVFFAGLFGPWLVRGKKYDAVFGVAQSPALAVIPAIIISKIKKAPLATWVGDLWPDSMESTGYVSNQLILGGMKKVMHWIYKNNQLILIQSRTFREPILALCDSVPIKYLPNPGEAIFSSPVSGSIPIVSYKDKFTVMYAGNIGSVQSLDMIVDAASLLQSEKDIRFVLVGSGSKSDWLKTEIETRALTNILLPGRFEPEYMPGILEQADALLVCLVKNNAMSLTVPAKTQTYMAAGRPILAAMDGEGARVVTEAGAGIATPAEDAEALAGAVLTLRNSSVEVRKQMGDAARKYYEENYDSKVVASNLFEYLTEMVSECKVSSL